ncbi:hypothetical protein [Armatimonas sp.]|uniref:hypothetical protein n=1 Tax=Armatimonas sp. TaxID=1872638 RepID=UPI00375151DA
MRSLSLWARLAAVSERFIATEHHLLEPNRSESVKALGDWWDKKTEEGMEGIIVKVRESIPVRNGFSSLRIFG